jgi:hypothetical protein
MSSFRTCRSQGVKPIYCYEVSCFTSRLLRQRRAQGNDVIAARRANRSPWESVVNGIIYLVGLVVVIMVVAGSFGFR